MSRHRATPVPRAPRPRAAGMTLVEMLAAIAIFLGLAGMVMQVLAGGLDLWATGEKDRQDSEQAMVVLDRLAEELRHAVACDGGSGEPRVKFFCNFVEGDPDGDGLAEFRAQKLLFVRLALEERRNPELRRAGLVSGGQEWYTGTSREHVLAPGEEGFDPGEALRATEGLTEICFFQTPDYRDGHEGRVVLWRALRTPIGGPDTLFQDLEDPAGPADQVFAQSVAENLLYLGFEFLDASAVDGTATTLDARGSYLWDSTRGILPPGEGLHGFPHAVGPTSLSLPDDDVVPRAVRITVVVEAPPDDAPQATLAAPLGVQGQNTRVPVVGGAFLRRLGAGRHLVKIGQEWVEIAESDGRTVLVLSRGRLGSGVGAHEEGTPVQVGQRFQRVVRIPAYREDLNRRVRDQEGG